MSIRYARAAPPPPPVADDPPSAPAIWRRAVEVLLVLAIGFVAFVGYGLVNNRWYHFIAIEGSSMAPTLMPGDLILVTRPPETVEEGMVLTLQVDGVLVTHRVIEVRGDGSFRTQGDANTVADDFSANRVRIVGQYQFRIPWLGAMLTPSSGAFFTGEIPIQGRASTWVDTVSTSDGALVPTRESAPVESSTPLPTPASTEPSPSAATSDPTMGPSELPEPTEMPEGTPVPTSTPTAQPTGVPTQAPTPEPTAESSQPAPPVTPTPDASAEPLTPGPEATASAS